MPIASDLRRANAVLFYASFLEIEKENDMGISRYYIRNIRRQINAEPLWPINVKYRLGDYGIYARRRGKFSVLGNVFDDFSIDSDALIRTSNTALFLVLNSSNTLTNDFKADVDSQPAEGTLNISFGDERAYVFHMFKAKVSQILLSPTLKETLTEAVANNQWHHRYRIIELAYSCPDVRFVYSLSSASSILLQGNVEDDLKPAKGTIDYHISSSSNMDSSMWIEGAACTPFVQFASYKKRELILSDTKMTMSDDWELQPDSSDSYGDLDFTDEDD